MRKAGTFSRLAPALRSQMEKAVAQMGRRALGGRERVEGLKAALDAT